MTPSEQRQFYWLEQGAAHYTALGLIAAAAVYLDLDARGLELWALFPVAVAVAGLALRWGAAPLLFMLSLALCLTLDVNSMAFVTLSGEPRVADILLAAAVLVYTMAQYRLTLINQAFPVPAAATRKRKRAVTTVNDGGLPPDHSMPSMRRVSPPEIGRIIMLAPVWALAAFAIWELLPTEWGNPGLRWNTWRAMWLLALIAAPLILAAAAFGYARWLHLTPAEAALFLQDVAWHETRREQRRINRWFAWAHVRQVKAPASGRERRWGRIALLLTAGTVGVVFIVRWIVGG